MAQITYACTLPIKYDVDVFVAGGGPSGLAAAVTAARHGARVFLAEGQACFGGMGTSGGLPRAFQDKVFTIEDRHLPGMVPIGPHAGGGNIGHIYGIDGTDEVSLTKALLHGRQLLLEYARFCREYASCPDASSPAKPPAWRRRSRRTRA